MLLGAFTSEDSQKRQFLRKARREINYERIRQAGGLIAIRQLWSEVTEGDRSALIVSELPVNLPGLVLAVRSGFIPDYGVEARLQTPVSEKRPENCWFRSKGAGIHATPDQIGVVYTTSKFGWQPVEDYAWEDEGGRGVDIGNLPLIVQLRHAIAIAEPVFDHRFGREDQGLQPRLGADKDWQIIDPKKLRF